MGSGSSKRSKVSPAGQKSNPKNKAKKGQITINPADRSIEELWALAERPLPRKEGEKPMSDNGLKIVRFVICSGYANFKGEREALALKVQPYLANWCHERKLIFVWDDLSIEEGAQTPRVAQLCLRLCRKYAIDNLPSFFIGLYGQKTTGNAILLDPKVSERQQMPSGLTLGEMITAHSAFRWANPNALFLYRDQKYMAKLSAEEKVLYAAATPAQAKRTSYIRQKIRDKFPNQVMDYQVQGHPGHANDIFSETDLRKINDFFQQRLDKLFPSANPDAIKTIDVTKYKSKLQKEKEDQAAFIIDKTPGLAANNDFFKDLLDESNTRSLTLLVGSSGRGKTSTALLIYDKLNGMIRDGKLKNKEDLDIPVRILGHFVGATQYSRSIFYFLRRVLVNLYDVKETNLPESPINVTELVHDYLKNESGAPVIIVVDGFGKFNPVTEEQLFSWIPKPCSSKVRIYLTMSSNSGFLEPFRKSKEPREIAIPALSMDAKRRLIQRYRHDLQRAGYEVQDDIVGLFEQSSITKDSQDPVKLKALLSLAASQGTERFRHYAAQDTLKILDEQLLIFEKHPAFAKYIVGIICAFSASRRGLTAMELRLILSKPTELLPKSLAASFTEQSESLNNYPSLLMEAVTRNIWTYLSRRENRMKIEDTPMAEAIRKRYINTEDDKQFWHNKLATLFEDQKQIFIAGRKANELPFHCVMMHDRERLLKALQDWEVVKGLYNRQFSGELLKYWKEDIGGYKNMEGPYVDELLSGGAPNTTPEELEERVVVAAWITKQANMNHQSMKLLQKALEMESNLGSRSDFLARMHHMEGDILGRLAYKGEFPAKVVEAEDVKKIPKILDAYKKALDSYQKTEGDEKYRKANTAKCQLRVAFWLAWTHRLNGFKPKSTLDAAQEALTSASAAMQSGSQVDKLMQLEVYVIQATCYADGTPKSNEWREKSKSYAALAFGPESSIMQKLDPPIAIAPKAETPPPETSKLQFFVPKPQGYNSYVARMRKAKGVAQPNLSNSAASPSSDGEVDGLFAGPGGGRRRRRMERNRRNSDEH